MSRPTPYVTPTVTQEQTSWNTCDYVLTVLGTMYAYGVPVGGPGWSIPEYWELLHSRISRKYLGGVLV